MITKDPAVESALKARLKELRNSHEVLMEKLRPVDEEINRIERMLREYSSGSKVSSAISDEDIVAWINTNAREDDRRNTKEIATAFQGDGRGFSKRLLRMARDGMIHGDPQTGYYVSPANPTRQAARRRAAARN